MIMTIEAPIHIIIITHTLHTYICTYVYINIFVCLHTRMCSPNESINILGAIIYIHTYIHVCVCRKSEIIALKHCRE